MRPARLELTTLSGADFKSAAFTDFATGACVRIANRCARCYPAEEVQRQRADDGSRTWTSSVSDGETSSNVCGAFHLVDESDGIVFDRDAARPIRADEDLIVTQTEVARSRARLHGLRR